MEGQAAISWYTLPGYLKEHVLQRLKDLALQSPDQWPAEEVERARGPLESRYVLKAPDGLRVVFLREDDGQLTARDMFLQELIDTYFSKKPEPASAP
jgi:hypothetical protein